LDEEIRRDLKKYRDVETGSNVSLFQPISKSIYNSKKMRWA
jgi:hypothetical protein